MKFQEEEENEEEKSSSPLIGIEKEPGLGTRKPELGS